MNLDRIVPKISKFSIVDLFARNWGCIKTGCIILSKVWSSWDYLTAVLSEKKLWLTAIRFHVLWLETCHPEPRGGSEREWNSLSRREATQPDFACAGYFFLIYLLLFLFWIDPFLLGPYLGSWVKISLVLTPFESPKTNFSFFLTISKLNNQD